MPMARALALELALGDGELAVADGQLHGALQIGVERVGGFDPAHQLGIALALVDERAVRLAQERPAPCRAALRWPALRSRGRS